MEEEESRKSKKRKKRKEPFSEKLMKYLWGQKDRLKSAGTGWRGPHFLTSIIATIENRRERDVNSTKLKNEAIRHQTGTAAVKHPNCGFIFFARVNFELDDPKIAAPLPHVLFGFTKDLFQDGSRLGRPCFGEALSSRGSQELPQAFHYQESEWCYCYNSPELSWNVSLP